MKDFIPDDEEFELLLSALAYYKPRALSLVSDEAVIQAAQSLADKRAAKSENEVAFEEAFGEDKNPVEALGKFMADLTKAVDQDALKVKLQRAEDNLIVLSGKLIRFRGKCRTVTTDEAIEDLLK